MDEKQIEKKVMCLRGSFLDVEKVDRFVLGFDVYSKERYMARSIYILRNYKSN